MDTVGLYPSIKSGKSVVEPNPMPDVGEYSRKFIVSDQEVAPFRLTGLKRKIFMVIYGIIVSFSLGGVAYSLYLKPLFALATLFLAYLINNLTFVIAHSRLHASFIELPENEMDVLCHHSFIHHYRNIKVYHETWLETRMSYFIDSRTVMSRPTFGNLLTVIIGAMLIPINPILAIAFVSTQFTADLLQSTIHEWYHNPVENRRAFYSPILFGLFSFLEKIKLASTRNHIKHHRHHLTTLGNVEKWLDLYVPFGEIFPSRMWKKALTLYVPGETNMTNFIKRVGNLYIALGYIFIIPAAYISLFYLLK